MPLRDRSDGFLHPVGERTRATPSLPVSAKRKPRRRHYKQKALEGGVRVRAALEGSLARRRLREESLQLAGGKSRCPARVVLHLPGSAPELTRKRRAGPARREGFRTYELANAPDENGVEEHEGRVVHKAIHTQRASSIALAGRISERPGANLGSLRDIRLDISERDATAGTEELGQRRNLVIKGDGRLAHAIDELLRSSVVHGHAMTGGKLDDIGRKLPTLERRAIDDRLRANLGDRLVQTRVLSELLGIEAENAGGIGVSEIANDRL